MEESAGHRRISFVKAVRNVVDVGHFVLVATVILLIRALQYGGSLSLSFFLSWVLFFIIIIPSPLLPLVRSILLLFFFFGVWSMNVSERERD